MFFYSHKGRKKAVEKKKVKRNCRKAIQATQILTKGALKGFDGIKVSIPTTEINMSAIVPSIEGTPKKKKKNSSKKKRDKRESESNTKSESQTRAKETSTPQKKVDVYEFMDNEDAELFEFRPSTLMERFKSINYKETPRTSKFNSPLDDPESSDSGSDGDDFVYMSDDYVCSDDETENSLMSCEMNSSKIGTDIKKSLSPLKRKDAVEKNAVMGKIFKHNAVRSDRKSLKAKETAKPKANLDQLFDSLLEDEPNSSLLNSDISPRKEDLLSTKNYEQSSKTDKFNRSHSNKDEFSSLKSDKFSRSHSSKEEVLSPKSDKYNRSHSNKDELLSPKSDKYNRSNSNKDETLSPKSDKYNRPHSGKDEVVSPKTDKYNRSHFNKEEVLSPKSDKYNRSYSNKDEISLPKPDKYSRSHTNKDELLTHKADKYNRSQSNKDELLSPKSDKYNRAHSNKDERLSPKSDKYNRSHSNKDEVSPPAKYRSPSPKHFSGPSPKHYDSSTRIDYGPSTSKKYDEFTSVIDYGLGLSKKRDMNLPKEYSSPKKYDSTSSKRQDTNMSKNSNLTTKHTESSMKDSEVCYKGRDTSGKPTKEKSPCLKVDDFVKRDFNADVFDDLPYDDMGVARQRARRKCTVGKQNVLAETWSSESEPDGLPPRPTSAESVVISSVRKKKGKKKDGHHSGSRRGNTRHVTFKKQEVEARASSRKRRASSAGGRAEEDDSDEDMKSGVNPYDAPVPSTSHAPLAPPAPRPRPRASNYYWSSEGDEEQEHQQQHGWIVGDSHKKLVTMLAHAKGRKRNDDKRNLIE